METPLGNREDFATFHESLDATSCQFIAQLSAHAARFSQSLTGWLPNSWGPTVRNVANPTPSHSGSRLQDDMMKNALTSILPLGCEVCCICSDGISKQ